MAKEFIERGALLARYDAEHVGPPGRARELIATAPAADVVPAAHGQWKRIRSNWYCTRCKTGYRITYGTASAKTFTFCPNCGAKMDKEATDA